MITITQTCDGCGEQRELRVGYYGQPREIKSAAEYGGWRTVKDDRHLCTDCINAALA